MHVSMFQNLAFSPVLPAKTLRLNPLRFREWPVDHIMVSGRHLRYSALVLNLFQKEKADR